MLVRIKQSTRRFFLRIMLLIRCLFYRGIKETINIVKELYYDQHLYLEWLSEQLILPSQISFYQESAKGFKYRPLVSIIVPTYNTDPRLLSEMIQSVKNQLYDNYELCIADDASSNEATKTELKKYEADPKIKIVYRDTNGGISEASNSALKLASGEYVALLDHDDVLCNNALYEVVRVLQEQPDLDFIYSNEDKLSENNKAFNPYFKSDINIELLRSQNYICHFSVIKKSLLDKIGGFESYSNAAQDWDLFLRVVENTKKIFHIKKILYHWRYLPGSASNSSKRLKLFRTQQAVVTKHLERQAIKAKAKIYSGMGRILVKYQPLDKKNIWMQVPSDARYVDDDREFVLLIPPGVKLPVNSWQKECFGLLSQEDVAAVVGFPVKRFNDDSVFNELIDEEYLEELLPRCSLSVLDHLFLRSDYQAALPCYAPFIVCRREVFNRINGFNNDALMANFKDIDLCLRIMELGYRVVETPFVRCSVPEPAAVLPEQLPILAHDMEYMQERWGIKLFQDPYYYNKKLLINS